MFVVSVVLANGQVQTVGRNFFSAELGGLAIDLSGALKRGVIRSIVIKESSNDEA